MKKYAAFLFGIIFLSVIVSAGLCRADEMEQVSSAPMAAPDSPATEEATAPEGQELSDMAPNLEKKAKIDSTSVLFDAVILRPAGALACAGGLIGAAIALPFSLLSNSEPVVVKTLIVEPFHYTFVRPIGEY